MVQGGGAKSADAKLVACWGRQCETPRMVVLPASLHLRDNFHSQTNRSYDWYEFFSLCELQPMYRTASFLPHSEALTVTVLWHGLTRDLIQEVIHIQSRMDRSATKVLLARLPTKCFFEDHHKWLNFKHYRILQARLFTQCSACRRPYGASTTEPTYEVVGWIPVYLTHAT